jgi:hypothetical protein
VIAPKEIPSGIIGVCPLLPPADPPADHRRTGLRHPTEARANTDRPRQPAARPSGRCGRSAGFHRTRTPVRPRLRHRGHAPARLCPDHARRQIMDTGQAAGQADGAVRRGSSNGAHRVTGREKQSLWNNRGLSPITPRFNCLTKQEKYEQFI